VQIFAEDIAAKLGDVDSVNTIGRKNLNKERGKKRNERGRRFREREREVITLSLFYS
jgi:hypothetical protein